MKQKTATPTNIVFSFKHVRFPILHCERSSYVVCSSLVPTYTGRTIHILLHNTEQGSK